MIHLVFKFCVRFLQQLSQMLGTTYETVNVWIFCVLWPLLTIGLVVAVIVQRKKIQRLNR